MAMQFGDVQSFAILAFAISRTAWEPDISRDSSKSAMTSYVELVKTIRMHLRMHQETLTPYLDGFPNAHADLIPFSPSAPSSTAQLGPDGHPYASMHAIPDAGEIYFDPGLSEYSKTVQGGDLPSMDTSSWRLSPPETSHLAAITSWKSLRRFGRPHNLLRSPSPKAVAIQPRIQQVNSRPYFKDRRDEQAHLCGYCDVGASQHQAGRASDNRSDNVPTNNHSDIFDSDYRSSFSRLTLAIFILNRILWSPLDAIIEASIDHTLSPLSPWKSHMMKLFILTYGIFVACTWTAGGYYLLGAAVAPLKAFGIERDIIWRVGRALVLLGMLSSHVWLKWMILKALRRHSHIRQDRRESLKMMAKLPHVRLPHITIQMPVYTEGQSCLDINMSTVRDDFRQGSASTIQQKDGREQLCFESIESLSGTSLTPSEHLNPCDLLPSMSPPVTSATKTLAHPSSAEGASSTRRFQDFLLRKWTSRAAQAAPRLSHLMMYAP